MKPFLVPRFAPESGRFLNTAYPELYLRGGVLSSETERDSLMLFGGRLASIQGFFSNDVKTTDQTLYGLKWVRQWSPGSYAGFGVGHTQGLPREGKGTTLSNTVFLADGSLRVTDWVKLVGEVEGNVFREDGQTVGDFALKAGPIVQWRSGHAEMNYRRVGPDFIFFRENLLPERDLEGVFASLEYHPSDATALYSSFDWSRSNLADNPTLAAVNSISALAGVYYARPELPALNFRVSAIDRASRPGSATAVASRSYSVFLESLYRVALLTPYLRLQGDVVQDRVAPESSARSGTMVAGVRTYLFNRLGAYLEGEGQWRSFDSGERGEAVRGRGGIAIAPASWIDLSADAEYSRDRERKSGSVQETLTASGRGLLTLSNQWYVNGDIRYTIAETRGTSASESSTFQFTVGLTRRFGWGERTISPLMGIPGMPSLFEVGTITGSVFMDLNRNGVKDPDEPGLPNVTVLLEDGTRAVTGGSGRFIFATVGAGIHQVRIAERELPADLNLLVKPSRRVELATRQTVRVDFPLLRAGVMRGRVLIDANGNGIADAGDTPLADALVYLEGTSINTFSDGDGAFAFENLLPGEYLLKLDEANLPPDVRPVSPTAIPVTVRSGKDAGDLIFLVGVEKKQVIRKVFGAKK
ncbi:SdrD B-like domain-containing protein [Geobacter sp.]|uniref:SdrD B-like domain-containing protein n=1 Tax=Geobacter sp. TaxID=46610 RepID=UPI00262727FD|nr:SdrD B-like domain-containing protein [Geobacter sp.]